MDTDYTDKQDAKLISAMLSIIDSKGFTEKWSKLMDEEAARSPFTKPDDGGGE